MNSTMHCMNTGRWSTIVARICVSSGLLLQLAASTKLPSLSCNFGPRSIGWLCTSSNLCLVNFDPFLRFLVISLDDLRRIACKHAIGRKTLADDCVGSYHAIAAQHNLTPSTINNRAET